MSFIRGVAVMLLAALLLAPLAASAGEPTKQLRATVQDVLAVIRDPAYQGDRKKDERRAKLRRLVAGRFDFTEMSRRSLAKEWRKRSEEEKREFISLFSFLMERSYLSKIEAYTDEEIQYRREKIDEELASVETVILTKKRQEIPIHYRLIKNGTEWRVYDVIIEGVSLVNNYRQQFRSVIRKTSYGDLLKKLRAKRDEG
ncbi:MAG: ABC transporter substrate-binding protein [bacterium]|nr:ABC transporter substrate-binding protein [bacterium]